MNNSLKDRQLVGYVMNDHQYQLPDGAVVIAVITSCTNTSNPSVLMAAELLAKKAVTLGLKRQPRVKASLAPEPRMVSDHLAQAGFTLYLDELGLNLVGYGCTTYIDNSGPLPDPIEITIKKGGLTAGTAPSGNQNSKGRAHPLVKTNRLAFLPLVIAYALVRNMNISLTKDPLGHNRKGDSIYLKDTWPTAQEIVRVVKQVPTVIFHKEYAEVSEGTSEQKAIQIDRADTYGWQFDSTYIRLSPFFSGIQATPDLVQDIHSVRILAMLGSSVTTDHTSPVGSIKPDSSVGRYLQSHGVERKDFNSYGSRRGNHKIMMCGTFANIRIRNEMIPGAEDGMTRRLSGTEVVAIYDMAMQHQQENIPLAVIVGKEYDSGSSRDWAVRGSRLLGARVVITESFERTHHSNLIDMGILPLEFPQGATRETLGLAGEEMIDITDLQNIEPGATVPMSMVHSDGHKEVVLCRCRIDTATELTYYQNDGILHCVIRNMLG